MHKLRSLLWGHHSRSRCDSLGFSRFQGNFTRSSSFHQGQRHVAVVQYTTLRPAFALQPQPEQVTPRAPLNTCSRQGRPKPEQHPENDLSVTSLFDLGRTPQPPRSILGAAPSRAAPGAKREKGLNGAPGMRRSDFSERRGLQRRRSRQTALIGQRPPGLH